MCLSSDDILRLQNIKKSIVAVGLVNENDTNKLILGTGFFLILKVIL